jgi:hypothetical protein
MSSHYLTQQDKKLRLRQKTDWGLKILAIRKRGPTTLDHLPAAIMNKIYIAMISIALKTLGIT